MTTANEFVKSGITGQTFREITEKFGQNLTSLTESDRLMGLYAIGFAWIREREHLPIPAAYDKALSWNVEQIEALFDKDDDKEAAKLADFASPQPTTTP